MSAIAVHSKKRNYKQLTKCDIIEFVNMLTTDNYLYFTEDDLNKIRIYVEADGCTGVADFYLSACIPHDFFYATQHDFYGDKISKRDADAAFRKIIQDKSLFGRLSPMSYWRWLGVRLFGGKAWEDDK